MDAISIDPRATIGSVPIPGDAPSGTAIRYEPEFAELADKVARMDTEGPLAVNWREVVELGCVLLRTRSKDLLIAAWVTLGLARTESWPGLSTGLQIVAGMVEHHWPGLEPPAKRERARVQMLEWIVERVTPVFADIEPPEADWPAVVAAYAAMVRIEETLDSKLTKETAALGELSRLLRERARSAERDLASRAASAVAVVAEAVMAPVVAAAAPSPAAVPAAPVTMPASGPQPEAFASAATPAPEPVPIVAIAAPAAVAAPGSAAEIDTALGRLEAVMQGVARGVQAADLADPRGYALLRAATWLSVAGPPMHANGVTPLQPPPKERVAYLAGQQLAGNHLIAIEGIEQTFAGAPFWLDAHLMTCRSLAALGATHEAARLAVLGAVAALLRRLPMLPELSFSDRTPLADAETKAWIAAEVMPASGGGIVAAADPVRHAARTARQRAMTGRPRDGLETLFEAAAGAVTGRERFRWLLAQAAYCLELSLVPMALSLLDHLDREVMRLDLEAWEPALAVEVSVLTHQVLLHNDAQSLRGPEARVAQLEGHRARLCRLDIVAAADVLKL